MANITTMLRRNESVEGHLLHLKALVRQERNRAYHRHDYLSHEWQQRAQSQRKSSSSSSSLSLQVTDGRTSIPYSKAKAHQQQQQQRHSPSSVGHNMNPNDNNYYGTDDHDDDDDDDNNSPPPSSDRMCIRWREKIIEWKYQVIDRFDLSREIVSISTYYLDQYLAMHSVNDERFQLLAMSSIYLAIKIHSPKKVTMRSIASTGDGLITVKHIEAMELSIIEALNWHLFPPTCVSFIENFYPIFLSSLRSEEYSGKHDMRLVESLEFSRFLAELSVCAYPFVSAKPSSIAIAAILYSLEYFSLPNNLRVAFELSAADASLDVNTPEVKACGKLLRRVYTLAMPPDMPFMAC